jgi:hypothetical protein
VWMGYSLFWDVTRRSFVVTAVSGQPIGPIYKGPETSVTEYKSTLRNIPEERKCNAYPVRHIGSLDLEIYCDVAILLNMDTVNTAISRKI